MLSHDVVVRGAAAGSTGATTTPTIFAQELTLPDIKEGPRGPVVVSLPLDAGHQRRWPSGSRPCSASTPASPRCT